jgi:hypothetical protein
VAYYIVGGEPIFLTHARNRFLTLAVLKDLLGSDDPVRDFLHARCEDNPTLFHQEWVEFNLVEHEARVDLQGLLNDYCQLHQTGHLTDLRDSGDIKERLRNIVIYPKGQIFALDHEVPAPRRWLTHRKKTSRTVRTVIDSATVKRAVGTLRSFCVTGVGYSLLLDGSGVSIFLPSARIGATAQGTPSLR